VIFFPGDEEQLAGAIDEHVTRTPEPPNAKDEALGRLECIIDDIRTEIGRLPESHPFYGHWARLRLLAEGLEKRIEAGEYHG
jgi:hypothetical protein